MMSGDWIPLSLPERIRALAPGTRIVSLGGATEASIWSILYPIERGGAGLAQHPVRPADVQPGVRVVGEELEDRPVWVAGQLYITGIGLALGYWRDEEKTRSSFVRHPRTGERLYRTGDLGRWLPDGTIEFLGREDFQVKVQGYRIELGEIESTLAQHAGVRAAVAGTIGDPRGARRLVAWVVRAEKKEISAGSPPATEPDPGHPEGTLSDPLARLELKMSRPGVRRFPAGGSSYLLPRAERGAESYLTRRSHREYLPSPLPMERLSQLLASLALLELNGLARYRYASAGALYPVQVYLWVRDGRVEGLPGGAYYYHPEEHSLVLLAAGAGLPTEIHAAVNRPAFEGSAFSLFLVGQARAIEPLYGSLARDFCLLEAGYMSQLLMSEAGRHEIGLCPIGGVDFERVRPLLALDDGHMALHTLLGGPIDPAWVAAEPVRTAGQADGSRAAELRNFLAARLPAYMVPSSLVFLDSLPLSSNGKVDRQRLPQPEEMVEAAYEAPRTELERTLAGILQEILGVERVGVHESFFHLGANSLHIVQLNNRLRAVLGRDLSIVEMFRFSNVSGLAAHLGAGAGSAPPVPHERAGSRAEARREEMARRRARRGGPQDG